MALSRTLIRFDMAIGVAGIHLSDQGCCHNIQTSFPFIPSQVKLVIFSIDVGSYYIINEQNVFKGVYTC